MTEIPTGRDPEIEKLRLKALIAAENIHRGLPPDPKGTEFLADFLLKGQEEAAAEKAANEPQVVHAFNIGDFTPTDQVDPSGRQIFIAPQVTITSSASGEAPKVEVGE
ncbi:MAG: hypothetical protein UY10_C0045G0005 [Microgenomates group bacterium GW2011_GWA2_47_8]|nr:MAG: hypothetical protein UY10_C0045G0005 [Microgenomates group bacterium GW2011_GWA2_47_8]